MQNADASWRPRPTYACRGAAGTGRASPRERSVLRGATNAAAWAQVIPMLAGNATEQTPPDLPSFLFKERIVYLVSRLRT